MQAAMWWCASGYVVVAYSILVSAPVPLELIGSWLGLDLGGFGTMGLGTGLNNKFRGLV